MKMSEFKRNCIEPRANLPGRLLAPFRISKLVLTILQVIGIYYV